MVGSPELENVTLRQQLLRPAARSKSSRCESAWGMTRTLAFNLFRVATALRADFLSNVHRYGPHN